MFTLAIAKPLVLTESQTSIGIDNDHDLACLLMLYCQEGLTKKERLQLNQLLAMLPVVEQHQIVENMVNESDSTKDDFCLTPTGAAIKIEKLAH